MEGGADPHATNESRISNVAVLTARAKVKVLAAMVIVKKAVVRLVTLMVTVIAIATAIVMVIAMATLIVIMVIIITIIISGGCRGA